MAFLFHMSSHLIPFPSIVTMAVVGLLAIVWALWYPTTTACIGDETSASSSNATTTAICQQLKSGLGDIITLPFDAQYATLREESWSATAWKHPNCIALPASASDVQKLIGVLVANDISFAIRSGGHSTNPFDANIDIGVLIATDKLNKVTYDAAVGLASIGPGARWDAVYTALDPYNVTVVGGRVLDVGVGGLILGGGLSYLSDLYGMACDNVVSYEIVLADGSVIEATSSEHSDLFWALKGGANNFGIVTKFQSKTYPVKQVWGGVQMFTLDQMPDVLQAYYEYQSTPNKDLYANLVINLAPVNDSVLVTLVYLQPVERPAAYAPFYSLSPVFEQTGFMTLHELQGVFPATDIPRWTWYSETFQPNSELFAHISRVLSTAPELASISKLHAGSLVATVQPINANVALAGQARGGNALGLQPVNQTWFSLNLGWWDEGDDTVAIAAIESLHAKIKELSKDAGVDLQYIFMNDANAKQPVIASYSEANVKRLRSVQQVYDPHLVFQKLVPGGQKTPAAKAT
ncbi:FAD-binding domain-containing protein [Whalleya microplaca]|nr:FAD-binding domain-containing protein [Whalleya microplaca]